MPARKKTDTQLEAEIEKKVSDYAKRRGWRARKMQFVGRRGCPDRWFFGPGAQLVIVEFKAPGKAAKGLSFAQEKNIGWMRDLGFAVHVIDDIEEGKALFDAP